MLDSVIGPFAQATTRLRKNIDARVLDHWIRNTGQHYVERILEVKSIVSLDFFSLHIILSNVS